MVSVVCHLRAEMQSWRIRFRDLGSCEFFFLTIKEKNEKTRTRKPKEK